MPDVADGETIYIFVNPKSGGNAASVLLSEEHPRVELGQVVIKIFAINDGEKGKKPGFLDLRECIASQSTRVKVVVAGGDGTVMWCLSELSQHGIDAEEGVVVGVLPFGTGNDFAKCLGWTLPKKFDPFNDDFKHLREMCDQWQKGRVILHDLWDCAIDLKKDGCFLKVDGDDRQKREITDDDGAVIRKMDLPMCNYFSLGVESRIGVGFDKGRTVSAAKNKMVYAKEGMKKSLFTSTLKVNEVIHSVKVGDQVAFTTKPGPHALLDDCASLVCVNIPSFASGMNLWGTTDKCGLVGQSKATGELSRIQKMGDGELEWVSFASVAAIGFEAANSGNSKRVLRAKGPFTLSFHDSIRGMKVYFQIDGEFFVMINPRRIEIAHSRVIRVLAHPESSKSEHYIFV